MTQEPTAPGGDLPLDQEQLLAVLDRGGLPTTDFLCVGAEIGTGFLGTRRLTRHGVVALREGRLVLGGDGDEIARMPIASVESSAPFWLGGKVVYVSSSGGTRYGLGLTLASVLGEGEKPVAKRSGALQGATDAAKRFRKALASAQGR